MTLLKLVTKQHFFIYADDTGLFLFGNKVDDLITTANETLLYLHVWTECKSLKIYTNQTKAILFRPKHKTVNGKNKLVLNSNDI